METFFMGLMLLMSIIGLTFIIERGVILRWNRVIPPAIEDAVDACQSSADLPALRAACERYPSPLSRLLQFADRHLDLPKEENSENAALILVDHQIGLMTGVRDYPIGLLKHNVVALAKAAQVLHLPIVVTTTARDSMWGPTIPELVDALPGIEIIDRSSVNAYDDTRVTRAIEATGRKKLIFAGLSLEVCAAFPAMTAVSRGLDAYVAVDACGTFSETKQQTGLLRMVQAGVVVSDYTTLMVEILKDNARPEAGPVYEAMDMDWAKLVGQISAQYAKK